MLDEPTNHLDIVSAEVLETALEEYDGTVIVVSHDRYFLDRIADRIVEVGDGDARSYAGGYTAWREAKAPKPASEPELPEPEKPKAAPPRLTGQRRF